MFKTRWVANQKLRLQHRKKTRSHRIIIATGVYVIKRCVYWYLAREKVS